MSKKTVYYDGQCPLCQAVVKKINTSSQKEVFVLRDIQSELPSAVSVEKAQKEIHVVDGRGVIHQNAEGILTILEEYPRGKMWANIGRLPIIKNILVLGYSIVAANRHLLFGKFQRFFWLKLIIAAGFISGLLLSVKLWTMGRVFPVAPVIPGLILPPIVSTFLFAIIIIGLVVMVFLPRPKIVLFLIIGVLATLAFFDQMRWQPWVYQYGFMLLVLALFSGKTNDDQQKMAALNTLQLIVASIYFFSGIQKANPEFVTNIFPWMLSPFIGGLSMPVQSTILSFAVLVPLVEISVGVMLLSKRFHNLAVLAVIVMHTFILSSLGPLGLNWNSVVWPWNLAMIFLVITLFWQMPNISFKNVFVVKKFPVHALVVLLFFIMPFFSLFNLWDSYLSFTLYSGNTNNAHIFVSDALREKLPPSAQQYTGRFGGAKNIVNFFQWSFDELNIPPYPEIRVYKAIARDLCAKATDTQDIILVVDGKPTLFNRGTQKTYYCSDL